MTEEKTPDLEARIALELYLAGRRGGGTMAIAAWVDGDMLPDEAGPFHRRTDGTYGDWFQEVYYPVYTRFRDRGGEDERIARDDGWTATIRNAVRRPEPDAHAVAAEVPVTQRYRCISSQNQLIMRACKAEAKEILEALCKD